MTNDSIQFSSKLNDSIARLSDIVSTDFYTLPRLVERGLYTLQFAQDNEIIYSNGFYILEFR